MTITKENIHAALADLATRYPQTFVLEKYRPHRPLKVGIAADILARCPDLDRRKLGVALAAYTRRVMYLRGMVAGAARVDLDGNVCGEVSAGDAEHAAAAWHCVRQGELRPWRSKARSGLRNRRQQR